MNSQIRIKNILKVMVTLLFLNFCFAYSIFAQSERMLVREGNQMYKDKKYNDAEVNYKKSLGVNKDSKSAQFNLGDAYYKQGRYDDAIKQFENISADKNLDKETQAKAFHNLGNSQLQAKKYGESIDAYKNALKLNSKDNDTRYNLAYAQQMLQQEQQKQQQKQDENKDQKDQKKDQQQQKDQKDQKDKDQQQQKDQQQKENEKKQEEKQAQKRDKISKEDAEKILQALNNDEKNTQKKLTKKDATKISIDKKW